MSEHLQDMYEDLMVKRRDVRAQLDEGEGNADQLLAQLNALNKALGDPDEVQDDLFDRWERIVGAGGVPDLNEMPGDF